MRTGWYYDEMIQVYDIIQSITKYVFIALFYHGLLTSLLLSDVSRPIISRKISVGVATTKCTESLILSLAHILLLYVIIHTHNFIVSRRRLIVSFNLHKALHLGK